MDDLNMFVFTSDHGTRHVDELTGQPIVAGAIALETTMIGKIQGIQFTGLSMELQGDLYDKAHSKYLKKFPVAGFKKLELWGIIPDFIKMTHNRLGFGTKLIWKHES
jgi:uncharacterized protein YhbP (UPF0306 family)